MSLHECEESVKTIDALKGFWVGPESESNVADIRTPLDRPRSGPGVGISDVLIGQD